VLSALARKTWIPHSLQKFFFLCKVFLRELQKTLQQRAN